MVKWSKCIDCSKWFKVSHSLWKKLILHKGIFRRPSSTSVFFFLTCFSPFSRWLFDIGTVYKIFCLCAKLLQIKFYKFSTLLGTTQPLLTTLSVRPSMFMYIYVSQSGLTVSLLRTLHSLEAQIPYQPSVCWLVLVGRLAGHWVGWLVGLSYIIPWQGV